MAKFKNKYRIESNRLAEWDYSSEAMYFITICTHNRAHHFGEVENRTMQLSEIGKIAEMEWLKTFTLRVDMNLWMGEFVVMPDHFHAMIGIGKNKYNANETNNAKTIYKNEFGPQSKNLASIVRGFKSSVTMAARKIDPKFKWQSNYHERIIRDEFSVKAVSKYITDNPLNWCK